MGTNPNVPNRILYKAADLNRRQDCRWDDVWNDSESIATKVCVQNSRKWNVMFESHLETCIDWTSLDFQFIGFLSNLLLKIFIQFVTDAVTKFRPTIHNLIFKNCPKFQALTFLRLMSCSMSNEQNLCAKKIYSNSNFYVQSVESNIIYW